MIVIQLMGGLGNQMFQYAAAYALAKANKSTLKLDLSFINKRREDKSFTNRDFELNVFNADINIINPLVLKATKKFTSLLKKLLPGYAGLNMYHERRLSFEKSLLSLPGSQYLIGYFQSEKYFLDYREDLLEAFSFKYPLEGENLRLSQVIRQQNSIAVHIRRGDYVSKKEVNDFHGVLSMDYYNKAIDFIRKKVHSPVFYFFSDDPAWVEANFILDSGSLVVNHNLGSESYRDLQLMSLCKHNIIANSSFSWWGAWLNKNPERIVIVPKNWFNKKSIDTGDLIPDTWVSL